MLYVLIYILPEISYGSQVLLPFIVCSRECVVIMECIHSGIIVLHIIGSAVERAIFNCIALIT